MRQIVAILLTISAVVISQEADKCDTPSQWEGFEVRVDFTRSRERRSYISYDATNMRFNVLDEERSPNGSERYRELFLHFEKIGYRINLSVKPPKCTNFTLTEPFRRIGVSTDDTLSYRAVIGTNAVSQAGVEVNGYTGESSERGNITSEWIQPPYNDKMCVPVSEAYRVGGSMVYSSFYNITVGIADPTVFIPPPECYKA